MRNAATTGKRVGYGWLYNWYAVDTGLLAPTDWWVPSDAEWTAMTNHLINTYGHIISDNVGGALKSTRMEWNRPNEEATDEFGFKGLPGGWRETPVFDTKFMGFRNGGHWWASSDENLLSDYAWNRGLTNQSSIIHATGYFKNYGFNVRCIQNFSVTESDGDTGTLEDIDDNIYTYVVIGNKRWMAENLRTTKYRNGNSIPEITDNTDWSNDSTGARCAYDNDHYLVYPPKK